MEFISESVGQLADRVARATLQHVREKVMEKWNAMYRLLTSDTAKQIYYDTPIKRNSRICEARHMCWIKMNAYSKIISILNEIDYKEYM